MNDPESTLANSTTTSVESAGGKRGSTSAPAPEISAQTILDLRKPGDLALVHRAVINNWPVSQEMKDQVCAQLGAALDAATGRMNDERTRRRGTNQFIKITKLALAMEARNLIDLGELRSRFPQLRTRYAEKRPPRRMRRSKGAK